ncbi:MAG: HAMP domain-containing sensor histidine kinase [Alphaproteobacteria bacterium]
MRPFDSLSARLLILTILFVMVSEVFIFAPSIGRFRLEYLVNRLASGHLAILALEATPDRLVNAVLEQELLDQVGAYLIALRPDEEPKLILRRPIPDGPVEIVELDDATLPGLIGDALVTMVHPRAEIVRVLGSSPRDPAVRMELVMDQAVLRAAMFDFAGRVFALSIIISLFTGALVFFTLQWLIVRPLRRISDNMVAFRQSPDNASLVITPGQRHDEIGVAERELAEMQHGLRRALRQREHLAALGQAVTKINHDLRNMLATAQLVSDRLARMQDPEVRRITAPLVRAIDRAIDLCAQTLRYARADGPRLKAGEVNLRQVIEEVMTALPQSAGEPAQEPPVLENAVAADLVVRADRMQLQRALTNLCRNALQAGARVIRISTVPANDAVWIDVADDGSGLPERAREHLFEPFVSTTSKEGSGLGLAIAREILRDHGGDLTLVETGARGTVFRLVLPIRGPRGVVIEEAAAAK